MLFSLIKATTQKRKSNLNTSFVTKSKFINLELKQSAVFNDFRVDYVPLIKNQTNYQSLIRVWYLVLANQKNASCSSQWLWETEETDHLPS